MRPRVRASDQTMLDRIVVNVIHVVNHVLFVANSVLPEPPLPEAAFAAFRARRGAYLVGSAG